MNRKAIFIVSVVALLFFRNLFCSFLNDIHSFVSAMFRKPKIIGAVLPSSSFLAESITNYIQGAKKLHKPIKILEVGAGTGAFTEKIIAKMKDVDVLDIIEVDQKLCDLLKKKFKTDKNRNKKINIHCVSILDWSPDYTYDFIISGLPFNAFDYNFVEVVLEKYKKIIKSGGIISYFEYLLTSTIRWIYSIFFSSKKDKVDFEKNIQARENFRKKFGFDSDFVFLNVPPAYVYHMKVKAK